MARFIKKVSKTAGFVPGTPVYLGERNAQKAKIVLIEYDESFFREKEVDQIEECFPSKETPCVSWINIDGIHDIGLVEKVAKNFDLHPLVLEDIVNTEQRPKYEDLEKYLFVSLKMFYYDKKKEEIEIEQVSLIMGINFVISFQEKEGDVFDSVRERIRQNKGRIKKMGTDYLTYSLMDAVVDGYFFIIEKMGEDIEILEEKLVAMPTAQILHDIHGVKKDMTFLRKSVWPLREVVNALMRGETKLIKKTTLIYLKDVYEHTIQIIETIETLRDLLAGMLDIYLSSISNKMNEIMKVLTIIATIFIPLTFITGVYGMNFRYMPELNWVFGYPVACLIMIIVTVCMLGYFKRKNWL
ncbi:MAG: magnesium/cobalt transporter CorA [Candidatus Omnitrophota bacterium]